MANDTLTLTARETLDRARNRLEEHIPSQAEGYKCTTRQVLDVLLGVAANATTLESDCAELTDTPDPETIRHYLNEQLRVEQLLHLQRCLNQALAKEIPARASAKPCDVAIDFHDRPYYGKAPQEQGLWIRAKA